MTDNPTFFRTIVAQVTAFINAYEQLQLLADRLAADTAEAGLLATAAGAAGRSELTSANFDNLRLAIQQIEAFMNASNANVPNGGTLRLSFYQIM